MSEMAAMTLRCSECGAPRSRPGDWEAAWPASHAMARARRDHPLELWQDFDRRPHGPDVVMVRTGFVPDEDGVLRERNLTTFDIGGGRHG